jgi:predicted DNA-binding protein (UPF0251 family)
METDVAAHQSPSLQAEIDEAWAIVYEALTPEQAEAVRLVYHDGLTQEEAAEKCGIERRSIGDRLQAAVKQIKQIPGIERTLWFIVTEQDRHAEGQRNRNYAKTLDAMRLARRVKREAIEKKLPERKAEFLAHLERVHLLKTRRSSDPLFVSAIGELRQLMKYVAELTARIADLEAEKCELEKIVDPDEGDPVYAKGFDDGYQAAKEELGDTDDDSDDDDDFEDVMEDDFDDDDDYDEEEDEDDDD